MDVMSTRRRRQPSRWRIGPPFRQAGERGWIADLPPELDVPTDGNDEPYRCRLTLREDGLLLGPAHAVHEDVEKSGRGAYSFWGRFLYFSTSDGSDPNQNGRSYTAGLAAQRGRAAGLSQWLPPPRLLRCAVVGLGNRGTALAQLAQGLPGVDIAWVIDERPERLQEVPNLFGCGAKVTARLPDALADPRLDIVFVTLPDHLHREVAVAAFDAGKHVFLEKPVATTAADASAIMAAWQRSGRVLQLGYVLRQAPFYAAIRQVVRDGMLGPVRTATLTEQLDVRHGASFMRRWHHLSERSGGLMVHKGCHDLDIACWLLDARPLRVASFGGQGTFAQPAPAGFCSACDRTAYCPYVDTALHERRSAAETKNPTAFGLDRCVFGSEKDIVDHQVVSFELDSGTKGVFTLAMQGPTRSERRITLIGDAASLDGVFEDGRFVVTFVDKERPPFVWNADQRGEGGHGGGDSITMLAFLDACVGRASPPISGTEEAMRGLCFALAAEQSRLSGTVVRVEPGCFVSS